MATPGKYSTENTNPNETRRFFDDYCNWQWIEEFKHVIFNSSAEHVASELMNSDRVQLFHEHILVKEPGTSKETPWHQDNPYYFITGNQTISFWTPMEYVSSASLRCVASSHKWEKPVLPTKWLNETSFYEKTEGFRAVPDPGDAVDFHFITLHGVLEGIKVKIDE